MSINHGNKVQEPVKLWRLLLHLQRNGYRVFKRANLQQELPDSLRSLSYQDLSYYLGRLVNIGMLEKIKKGVYMLLNTETPITGYEIAMHLLDPVMISHRSAFRYHDLTDQVLYGIILSTLKSAYVPQKSIEDKRSGFNIRGINYTVICETKDNFFGQELAWDGVASFKVTDLEKTFLDGLAMPQECGGLQEVIWAFREEFSRCNLEKIISYAMRMSCATSRRLGWVLDTLLGVGIDQIQCLAKKDCQGYRSLDPSYPSRGPYNAKWRIRENHHY